MGDALRQSARGKLRLVRQQQRRRCRFRGRAGGRIAAPAAAAAAEPSGAEPAGGVARAAQVHALRRVSLLHSGRGAVERACGAEPGDAGAARAAGVRAREHGPLQVCHEARAVGRL